MSLVTESEITPAPRSRCALAGLLDIALAGGGAWLWRRSARGPAGRSRWAPPFGAAAEFLREQLGSPGQHLLGLRTVDRRTGRRVELWRSGLLLATGAAGQVIISRFQPPADTPEQERERERFAQEIRALAERHGDEPGELAEARDQLFDRYSLPNNLSAMPAAIAVGIVVRRLRRRLAPTVEIIARRGGSHSPYERPITSSMISSVPAPIRFRRASRQARSTLYSFM
jgi:hypothetical protein